MSGVDTNKPSLLSSHALLDAERRLKAVNDADSSTWGYQSVVPADRLSVFFDSDEEDEALLAQLQMERKLFRELNGCETRECLAQRVATILADLGFSEYTFVRLDAVHKGNEDTGLIPKIVLSSHNGEELDISGMILHPKADNTRIRHLSMLYHFIASSRSADSLGRRGDRYILILSADDSGCYITHSGLPKSSRYMSMSSTSEESGEDPFRKHVASKQQAIDLLVNTIEGVGIKKFPEFFEPGEKVTVSKINARPLRLLNTLAKKDVTLREAADLLHLSTDTINKHVAAAKTALGTSTIAGTVWKAVQEGLIDESN